MTASTKTKRLPRAMRAEECPWESGKLGRSGEHVTVASEEAEAALDEAVCLQAISVRLQTSLIKDLKMIAAYHGIGYQPLMRDALNRFVRFELREIAETLQKVESARAHLAKAQKRA